METLGSRIKSARLQKGLRQQAVADHFGINRVSVTQWEADTTRPESDKIPELAKLLGATADWLLTGQGVPPISDRLKESIASDQTRFPRSNAKVGERVSQVGPRIKVYGSAVGGTDGQFVFNGSELFEVMAPPSLSPVVGAYAVTVSGDSMFPRYEDGEIAYVDPTRRPKKGQYVVAQIHVDENEAPLAYVKRFIRHNSDELVLEQFNPAKELRFPHSSVHAVHCIVMAGDA